jgi:hypothetical protein
MGGLKIIFKKLFNMSRKYSEADITWSSIEKYVPYKEVIWGIEKNGIPLYTMYNDNGGKIDINDYYDI